MNSTLKLQVTIHLPSILGDSQINTNTLQFYHSYKQQSQNLRISHPQYMHNKSDVIWNSQSPKTLSNKFRGLPNNLDWNKLPKNSSGRKRCQCPRPPVHRAVGGALHETPVRFHRRRGTQPTWPGEAQGEPQPRHLSFRWTFTLYRVVVATFTCSPLCSHEHALNSSSISLTFLTPFHSILLIISRSFHRSIICHLSQLPILTPPWTPCLKQLPLSFSWPLRR